MKTLDRKAIASEIVSAIKGNLKTQKEKGTSYKGLSAKYSKLYAYLQSKYSVTKEESWALVEELASDSTYKISIGRAGAILYLPEDFKASQSAGFADLIAKGKGK
jgi:NMD protein affecting ribosome stability and mRNA decay